MTVAMRPCAPEYGRRWNAKVAPEAVALKQALINGGVMLLVALILAKSASSHPKPEGPEPEG
jgi:hypothetical protein